MRKIFMLSNNENIKIKKKEYLAPSYVFIPVNNKLIKKINLNDKVLKGEYFTNTDYSSVSGVLKGSKECKVLDKKVKTLAILNNFKEQRVRTRKSDIKNNLNNLLDKSIKNKLEEKHENLVLTCFMDDPTIYNIRYYIADNYHEILDTLDYLKKEYSFKNIYIIVKDTEKNSIEKFIKIIGNYPEIRFIAIPNVYPVYNTDYIENNLNIQDACILGFKELFQVFHIINHGSLYNEIYLTINIENKPSIVVKTKIGTLVTELLDNLKISYQDFNIYLNGFIKGFKIDNLNDLIISNDLESINITKKEKHIPLKCINCGNCFKYCPSKIDPRCLTKEDKDKCINCGLCNYICPCFIDLRSIVKEDK